jgi:hypothetical protein
MSGWNWPPIFICPLIQVDSFCVHNSLCWIFWLAFMWEWQLGFGWIRVQFSHWPWSWIFWLFNGWHSQFSIKLPEENTLHQHLCDSNCVFSMHSMMFSSKSYNLLGPFIGKVAQKVTNDSLYKRSLVWSLYWLQIHGTMSLHERYWIIIDTSLIQNQHDL